MASAERELHSEFILENQLRTYAAQGMYPMHMPGHKRQQVGERFGEMAGLAGNLPGGTNGLPYGWDVTEVPGTDDLHDAQGILREAMDRTAELYGAARTWYLVNGSTCGLLAGIRAIAPYGSEVIVARNCHKAVYHAIELQNLTVHWVWPARDATFDIYTSIDPRDIENLLEQYPETAAVVLTSPTYEGIVSDIKSIADICHEHRTKRHRGGIPLLVDEAHGAHFMFHGIFPRDALDAGADIVVQSPHKTLPSLTQTAWMHVSYDCRVPWENIERELDVFETSSPSYPLMASLDGCTQILQHHGDELFERYVENLEQTLLPARKRIRHLKIFGYNTQHDPDDIYAGDPSKILLSGRGYEIDGEACTGAYLADLLREDYQIETEMHLGWNVLAMTTVCDTREGMQRFADAIEAIDQRMQAAVVDGNICSENTIVFYDMVPDVIMPIAEAVRMPSTAVTAEHAVGRIAAEYVYCYPPGIPLIVPGERIEEETMQQLLTWELQGATVHHSNARRGYRVTIE